MSAVDLPCCEPSESSLVASEASTVRQRLGFLCGLLENERVVGAALSFVAVGIGVALLVISLLKPWYTVPVDLVRSSESDTGFQALMQESRYTASARLLVIGAIVCIGWLLMRCAVRRTRLEWAACRVAATRIIATLFVLMLFFPWLAVTWDVPLATHAAWLQDQHYNLTWLGGDVYNNAEGRDDIAKTGMIFSTNPLRTGVYALPDSRVGGLRLSSLGFILEWLGYGMVFTQFDGRGWILGSAGCLMLLIGLVRTQSLTGRLEREAVKTSALPCGLAFTLAVLAIGPPLICGHWLDDARVHHARGDYQASIDCFDRVANLMPVLAEHSQFVSQKGYLLTAQGETESPLAMLVQGVEMEARGMLGEAEATFFAILDQEKDLPAWQWNGVTREAYRALIRAGLEDFNSGQNVRCHELFRILRDRCPDNLKVNVALQFAALRMDRAEECTEQVNRVYAIYQGFDALDSKGVKSLLQANAARAHFLANNPTDAALHHVRTIRP